MTATRQFSIKYFRKFIGDKVIVKQGLNEGDKIVTDGAQKLKDSSAVQIGPPKNNKGNS